MVEFWILSDIAKFCSRDYISQSTMQLWPFLFQAFGYHEGLKGVQNCTNSNLNSCQPGPMYSGAAKGSVNWHTGQGPKAIKGPMTASLWGGGHTLVVAAAHSALWQPCWIPPSLFTNNAMSLPRGGAGKDSDKWAFLSTPTAASPQATTCPSSSLPLLST